MIEVRDLRKTFGSITAVDGVSFRAEPGRIFGLLGPNGAGKSTTLGCISGLLSPTEGRISVMGHDVASDGRASRQRLGVVPQELALYEDLNARQNLAYWGAAYGLSGAPLTARVNSVLSEIGLLDRASEAVKKFSGGMKRRLNFGCGIVHEPETLLLDEPTVGVDPQSRVKLLDLVREKARGGLCVLYTTHHMEEAESLCDELAVIDHGRIVASGTLEELRSSMGERDLVRVTGLFEIDAIRGRLEAIDGVDIVQADPESLTLAVPDGSRRLPALLGALAEGGAEIRETTLARANLETLFIKLTGRELRE